MKKYINNIQVMVAVLLPFVLLAQTERWVYRYNGPGNDRDYLTNLVYGNDGNIYTVGYGYIGLNHDIAVIALTPDGVQRWIYRYNGPNDDIGWDIAYGADDNLYVGGITWNGDADYPTVISLDTTGTERWIYRYNNSVPGVDDDMVSNLIYGLDGNIYVVGCASSDNTGYDILVISLTPSGDERWVYTYNGPANSIDKGLSIVYGLDNNIYVAGWSVGNSGYPDFMVISLNSNGTERWVYRYDGPANEDDVAHCIVYGQDGNLYVGGRSCQGYYYDFIVLSLTNSGTERWIYTYNGPGNGGDIAEGIVYGSDGNLYAAGRSIGSGTADDIAIVSLTPLGVERWIYTYDGPAHLWDWPTGPKCIVYGLDNHLYVAGRTWGSGGSDFTVIALTNAGEENWVYRYNGPGNNEDIAWAIVYGSDGNIYASGWTYGSGTYGDFTVISLESVGGVIEEKTLTSSMKSLSASSPFRDKLILKFNSTSQSSLKITLYDILGNAVFEKDYPCIPSSLIIDDEKITKLNPGIYFLSISSGREIIEIAKLIKI